MIKNYLKIAWRNLLKNRVFSFINIFGLAVGLWCVFLIALWIMDEFGKDNFHSKGNQIAQVLTNIKNDDGSMATWDGTGYPVAEALSEQIPEIKAVIRRTGPRESILGQVEKSIGAQVIGADTGFFDMFSFPLSEGQPNQCLQDIKNIVLSEEMANHYFPNVNAMGQTINLMLDEVSEPFLITGVFKKITEQSTLRFDAVVPLDNFLPMNNKSWGNTWVKTFVFYGENAALGQLGEKMKHLPAQMGDDDFRTLSLQPLKDRYLYSKFENGLPIGGRIDNVILFALIGIFILLIACFNFINLTTTWAVKRSKEIGIKKVLGAGKWTLIAQFLMEAMVLVLVSVCIAVFLTKISTPVFNTITEKQLHIDFTNIRFYGILAVISLVTVLLSGLYPAFSLSSLKSRNGLHEKLKDSRGETTIRKGLVVLQFFLCMAMIMGTLVVYLQLRYIQNKNLGLNKEHIVYMPMDNATYLQSGALKAELANFSGIEKVSSASSNFIDQGGTTSDPVWEGGTPQDGQKWFSIITSDFGLTEMLNIPIKEGRNFSSHFASDTLNYLVNQEAVEVMGLKNPIGKSLSFWGDEGGKIVGVTDNFHFASLHNSIGPMIIRCRPKETYLLYVKVRPGQTVGALAHMEKSHKMFSELPFHFRFLDEAIEKGYANEHRVQQLVGIFAVVSIIISCLGLFGLAMFTAQQRLKEVAVRKILGANIGSLFKLLSKGYLQLVGIALLIAIPLIWYVMNSWIQDFAFHIEIQWWMFGLVSALILFITLFTVSYHTLKLARTSPSKSLQTE
ncbi:ABC-type antimicrobial peptide transport system permease subunit [Saonia flava]|uniref:ABC-type antimicrobial peptide transport system permease subunit n=1 Tax=Saonia flava TaxID=523696 RepID=A0A846QSN0_9FLAO|nr:FtsX-like permease family protein [Saonia flava]NJB70217.1 ABC-type antimicrobial peptide transport system permease subunit [Saonia flava]